MSLVKRVHNPFQKHVETLYMLLDITNVKETKCLLTGTMQRVQLLGRLKAAEGPGRKIIAPPLEGRGFSKLEPLQLQYLYWNTTGKRPSDDYAALIAECKAAFLELEPNDDPIHSLQFLVDQLEQAAPGTMTDAEGKLVPPPGAPAPGVPVRPKGTTTTGIIWAICDEVLEELHKDVLPEDWKPLRAEASRRCDAEGFNPATFGVQYSKWAKAKKASNSPEQGVAKD